MFFPNSRGHVAFGSSAQLSHPALAATALGALLVAASTGSALSHGCMPNHARPLVVLKDMGPCSFDQETLSFAGEPVAQATADDFATGKVMSSQFMFNDSQQAERDLGLNFFRAS